MAKPSDKFSGAERAAIRALFIAIKRAWNAAPNSSAETEAIEEIIEAIESTKDFV